MWRKKAVRRTKRQVKILWTNGYIIIELIKKTGDRLVVFDASAMLEPFVIMDLASYNKLRGVKALHLERSYPMPSPWLRTWIFGKD